MYGYVVEGIRPGLAMRQIGGVWFAMATVPRQDTLRHACPLPPPLTEAAARYGLRRVEVQRLRLAVLPQLLDIRGDLRRETAALRAAYASPQVYAAAAVLASRVRYLSLEVDAGGEALARALWERFGLCVGRTACPAVTVSFGGAPQGDTICLGEDCWRWQRLTYAPVADVLPEVCPPPEQLLAALFEVGRIKKEDIRVKTFAANA